ncbi:MAG: sodium:solute symporter [Treponema sp. CETP13]|nr:MAG: sodium:solute symporter [Treponema sp. CETP13]
MKKMTTGKMWLFAVGQFGWALLSGLVASWLVYFYQPDASNIADGQIIFIPQGKVILGALTILGLIAAGGRIFDAITDPLIASASDKCKSPKGRRIPFMKWSAIPFAVVTVLVFCAPINHISWGNAVWLFIFIPLYYLAITAYCTPYTALFAELGSTPEERMKLSTFISLTFIVGTAVAYVAPTIWGVLEPVLGRVVAMRTAFSILAIIATICMLIPVFFITEKDYVNAKPSETNALQSLKKTFGNAQFRVFVGQDIVYFIALTMFQTGLPFFITLIFGLPESMFMPMFVGMTVLSLVFYLPINAATKKFGKKRVLLFAFLMFTISYTFTTLGTWIPLPSLAKGIFLVVCSSLPMAIFGILPQAMVADIAEYDGIKTGENRQGMFFAARTFCFKLGQSLAMLLFTSISIMGSLDGSTTLLGCRMVAMIAAILCACGGIVLIFFNEKKILNGIKNPETINK